MENALTTYLNRRLREEKLKTITTEPGPVITISREVGCDGLKLARKLAERLNNQDSGKKWKVLSKEIFSESARELDLAPEKVRQIFRRTDRHIFDEILDAFNNRHFKSERIIVKTVVNIVRSFAVDGFSIIVGRAGHIIARDIKNAFHLRLFAPLDYRINNIMKNNQMSREEAELFIRKVENERIAFRKAIRNENTDADFFDLFINRASFGNEEVIDIIETAINKKQIVTNGIYKMEYF